MNYDMMNNNRLSLTGTISSPVTFTHEVLGESFFETTIEVKRLSGMTDVIPLTISDRLMCDAPLAEGEEVTVEGQFRSHNKTVGEKSKLLLTAFARDVIRPALVGVDPNSLEVLRLYLQAADIQSDAVQPRDMRRIACGQPSLQQVGLHSVYIVGQERKVCEGTRGRHEGVDEGKGAKPKIH